jgi:hypothetical protein
MEHLPVRELRSSASIALAWPDLVKRVPSPCLPAGMNVNAHLPFAKRPASVGDSGRPGVHRARAVLNHLFRSGRSPSSSPRQSRGDVTRAARVEIGQLGSAASLPRTAAAADATPPSSSNACLLPLFCRALSQRRARASKAYRPVGLKCAYQIMESRRRRVRAYAPPPCERQRAGAVSVASATQPLPSPTDSRPRPGMRPPAAHGYWYLRAPGGVRARYKYLDGRHRSQAARWWSPRMAASAANAGLRVTAHGSKFT